MAHRIQGPYRHRPTGRWRLRVTGDDGKARDQYYPDEPTARAAAAEIRGEQPAGIAMPEAPDVADPLTPKWWHAGLALLGQRLLAEPENADISRCARAFAQLARASSDLHDVAQLEAQLHELTEWRKTLEMARAHGTKMRPTRPDEGVPTGVIRREDVIM